MSNNKTSSNGSAKDLIENIQSNFEKQGYICNTHIATAIFLSQSLGKPILVEGPPGVGKTELAKATAEWMKKPLIRLQCYEGLDEAKALYEWKYGKQLLYTQVLKDKLNQIVSKSDSLESSIDNLNNFDDIFFSEKFLEPRPLLKAIESENGSVLLIDEIDKSDDEFEAFLLEILSDYQVSIPEIGTIKGNIKPSIVFYKPPVISRFYLIWALVGSGLVWCNRLVAVSLRLCPPGKPILGGSSASPSGNLHFRKTHPTKNQ